MRLGSRNEVSREAGLTARTCSTLRAGQRMGWREENGEQVGRSNTRHVLKPEVGMTGRGGRRGRRGQGALPCTPPHSVTCLQQCAPVLHVPAHVCQLSRPLHPQPTAPAPAHSTPTHSFPHLFPAVCTSTACSHTPPPAMQAPQPAAPHLSLAECTSTPCFRTPLHHPQRPPSRPPTHPLTCLQ